MVSVYLVRDLVDIALFETERDNSRRNNLLHESLVHHLIIPLALNRPQDGTRKLGVLALYMKEEI